jgi:hypothetical protein
VVARCPINGVHRSVLVCDTVELLVEALVDEEVLFPFLSEAVDNPAGLGSKVSEIKTIVCEEVLGL